MVQTIMNIIVITITITLILVIIIILIVIVIVIRLVCASARLLLWPPGDVMFNREFREPGF